MVSNKKYIYALQKWNEWENMATDVAKQNGVLLKEMKEINDLSIRVNENNGALIAECRRLREQLAERDNLLANAEVETAKKIFADIEDTVFDDEGYFIYDRLVALEKKYRVEDLIMEKYKYPNYECGECPVWLGAKTMAEAIECCKKRHCEVFEEGIVDCDSRCFNCDEYDPVRGCMVEE